jgi:O-antigen/teichoic acid export membrane protein
MLLHHSAVYLVARGVPGIVSFVALAVFTRLLTPEEYGRYALVIAGVGLVDVLLLQWLRLGLLRFLPAEGIPRDRMLATIVAASVRVALIASIVGVLAIVVFLPDPALRGLALFGVVLVWLQAFFELNQEYVRTELSPARYGAFAAARSLLALGVGASLVLLGWGAAGPVVGLAVAFALPILLLGGYRPWVQVSLRDRDPALARSLLAYGAPLALTAALGFVVSSSDRFLLAGLVGTAEAGRYAVGYDFAQFTLGMLMTVVNLAAYPIAVRALEEHGVEAAREQLRRNAQLLLAVSAPAAAGMAVLAANVTGVLLGEAFRDAAAGIVPWIALAALVAGAKSFYVDLGFQLGRRTVGQVWVMAGAAVVNLSLNLWWIPRWGLMGAVYATVVAYLVALVAGWWLARRVFPLPAPPLAAVRVLAATAVMVLAVWPMRTWEGPVALATQVAVGVAVYAVALGALHWSGLRAALRARRAAADASSPDRRS